MSEDTDLLDRLQEEATRYNSNSNQPSYIGEHWFQLAFDAIHSEVCGEGRWPHKNEKPCNKRRKPETLNHEDWDQGSISELALQLIHEKFLKEGESTAILGAITSAHAANLAVRHAYRFLYRIQIREREAGRITERITRIFDQRNQYFPKDSAEKAYFSRDGQPPHANDLPAEVLLIPIVRQLPLRPWKSTEDNVAAGSPYGNPALKIGATKILEAVRAVGKWVIFDIFEDVLAFHQNVALSIGRGVPRADTELRDSIFEGSDFVDTQMQGISDELIESAHVLADEIRQSWTTDELVIWELQGANTAEFEAAGMSRQTHQNRLVKLVGKVSVRVNEYLAAKILDIDLIDQQEFTLQIIHNLNDRSDLGESHE